jgi:hypothetical protein
LKAEKKPCLLDRVICITLGTSVFYVVELFDSTAKKSFGEVAFRRMPGNVAVPYTGESMFDRLKHERFLWFHGQKDGK